MSIATQLKQLEAAFPASTNDLSSILNLSAEDSGTFRKVFSLAPSAFVDAWARALALTDREYTAMDRETFIRAIQTGTNRLKIIDALYARKRAYQSPLESGMANDICQPQDQFVIVDHLQRFAPDDHAAFVRYAFAQICVRGPTPTELLSFDFDLRRGSLERRAAIKKIVRIANQEGRAAIWDSLDLEQDKSDPTCARTLPTGFGYDEEGRESLIFVRALAEGGWMVAPDILRQSPKMDQKGWMVQEGWIFAGPKRSLHPGSWRVNLDILQQEEHVLHVDLVANAGLDVVQQISICGSFTGGFCVTIASHHRFVELRMHTPGCSTLQWINPRNISMHRVS